MVSFPEEEPQPKPVSATTADRLHGVRSLLQGLVEPKPEKNADTADKQCE